MGYGKVFTFGKDGNTGIVTFDVSGEQMNTWTEQAVDEFCALLDDLERLSDVKGVVLISGKSGNFHAGANLKMLDRMKEKSDTNAAMSVFHKAFRRLSELKFPVVAAIDGYCLGGGLEFALTCTARIAKDSKNTQIGLPECNLGIFPGGGGTQRLPRLIGYPGIEFILRGKIVPAAEALQLGIVDRLIPADADLLQQAVAFLDGIASGTVTLKRTPPDLSQIDGVMEIARKETLKATKGREIPGLMLALKSIGDGLKVSLEEGLEIEKNNFVEAVLTNEAKGSIHTFFLKTMSDKPKGLMTKGFQPKQVSRAAVLGFGTMGRGIVIDILRNMQIPVIVKDVQGAIEPGKAFVRKILEGMVEKKKLKTPVDDLMNLLQPVTDYSDAFQTVDLVIEAVFEDIKVKEKVYGEVCSAVRDDCIIATNTSSIPMESMASFVTHTERFGGLHFFSPVWLMQMVEVIRGERTSQDTVDNLLNFAASIRKRPIVCRDNSGFVVNAVLFPYFVDALGFLESGVPIEEIDRVFVQFGMPVGPIRLLDEVGIDVGYNVMKGRGFAQDTLRNVVGAGRLGLKKSGQGFFLKDGSVDPEVLPLISVKEKQEVAATDMQAKVLTDMVTVGKDLLDRKIVEDPRMIDIGMIWGTGFPAEKGGPMKWADLIGLSEKLFGKTFYAA